MRKYQKSGGKLILGVHNQGQVEHDHVHVDSLVVVGDSLQMEVRLSFRVLIHVYFVQPLQGHFLQFVHLLVDRLPIPLLDYI